MNRIALLAPLAFVLASGAAASLGIDPVRDRIIADAKLQSPASLAFDRTTHVVQVGGGSRTEIHRVDRWDGKSWSLISLNGKPPTDAEIKEQAKATLSQPVPGYHRLAGLLATATESSIDAQGRTVLVIPQLPAKTIVNDGTDISPHLKAEAVIATSNGQPWVQQLRLKAREPFKMSWVLKVMTFDQVSEYKLDAGGKPRLASQSADSQGTMFGISGGQKSDTTYAYR